MRKTSKDALNVWAIKLKKGDPEAAGIIFDKFAQPFFRFFMQRLGVKNIAEDLTQEVFLKLMRRIETFDDKSGNFTPWFWQVARNTLNDYFRSKKSIPLSEISEEQSEEFVADESLDKKELALEILDKVREFSEEDQEMFLLRYIEDMSYDEIAKATGRTAGSLRVSVHRMIKKIREIYGD